MSKTTMEGERFEEVPEQPGFLRNVKTRAVGYQILFDFVGGEGLPAVQVSEGTLITLALLTIMTSPGRPNLVLIDELERGLHPKALGELVRQIRELQKQFPELQIVGTTHSPYLIDHFQPEEIVLTTLRDDGSVSARRFSESQTVREQLDVFTLGEIWTAEGDEALARTGTPDEAK